MAESVLYTREIDLSDSYDIIVVGGGPAGCAAAAAAGREGASVLLVETTGALGGMGTSGLVPAWAPTADKYHKPYRGLVEKVISRCAEALEYYPSDSRSWVPVDPEFVKRLFDELMEENNVDVLFNTMLCDVNCEDGEVTSVLVSNKSGLSAYSAGVYIDCTGDGDLAYWAGAEYEHGPWLHTSNTESPIYKIVKDPKYTDIPDYHLCNHLIGPYRCLTPKGIRNVLVAGRAISSDRSANGSLRVMPTCMVTGEAAGVAAAQARKLNDSDVHAVDTDILRDTLRKNDVYLPLSLLVS